MATVTQQPAPGSYTTSTVLIEAKALQDMLNRLIRDFENRYGVTLGVWQRHELYGETTMQDGSTYSKPTGATLDVEVKL